MAGLSKGGEAVSRHLWQIVLDGERPLSWNKFYSGRHWAVRAAEAERVHLLMLAHLPPDDDYTDCWPVRVVFTAYLAGRMMDADNLTAKLYLDGVKGTALLPDDDPRYLDSVTLRVRRDKLYPRVVIDFYSGE